MDTKFPKIVRAYDAIFGPNMFLRTKSYSITGKNQLKLHQFDGSTLIFTYYDATTWSLKTEKLYKKE